MNALDSVSYYCAIVGDDDYLEEPRKMHPNAMTTTTLRMSALRGNLSVGWTFAKNREAGRPPSL